MNIKDLVEQNGFSELLGKDGAPRRFVHLASKVIFVYVAGGRYMMGLSEREEAQARELSDVLYMTPSEMRPVHPVHVPDLLVAEIPLSNRVVSRLLADFQTVDSKFADFPAFLSRERAVAAAQTIGARLPSEVEWEYFCRAGSQDLFTFGADLPEDSELTLWLSSDLSKVVEYRCNGFGLYCLFNPEWCSDQYRTSYAQDASLVEGSFVVRGGGAYFWPWQDEEWVWCASAMRCPSKDVIDQLCCVRPVLRME
jgi:formylglycine-generating enzyme required for sulfatase activity